MDFRLTKEEALFQKMCRQFALNEVEPIAAEIDEQERYPEETVQKLMKYGLMGIQFPKEVGGSGGNYVCYTIAIEAAYVRPPARSFPHTALWALGRSTRSVPRSRRKSGCVR